MSHEQEMRNSPIYKVLEEISELKWNSELVAEMTILTRIEGTIKYEAPETYKLFMSDKAHEKFGEPVTAWGDSRLGEVPDCSPSGEPCGGMPDPDDSWDGYDSRGREIYQDKETYQCPICTKSSSHMSGAGVCETCEENGYWIDPAGGVHQGDDEDPAAMYE